MKNANSCGAALHPQGVLRNQTRPADLDIAAIPAAFNNLEHEVNVLADFLDSLNGRLTPAVCEVPPPSAQECLKEDVYPHAGSLVAERAETLARRVRNLRESVQGILDRLQV
jgi:hypothetical protein